MEKKVLIPDVPKTQGEVNVLRRAKQLTGLTWTPRKSMPAVLKSADPEKPDYHNIYLPAWRPLTGVVYSSVRLHEKYVGYNVLPETYLSALANPNSCLYTKSMHGMGVKNCGPFYGTVCSEFVSYCMQRPLRLACARWPGSEGIERIELDPFEKLQLCDIVLNPKQHIMLVTGIDRDEAGKIVRIEISESKLPNIAVTKFTPQEFTEAFLKKGFEIFRNHHVDEVTYTPDPCVYVEGDPELPAPKINDVLLPDYGNKANYLPSEPVELSVFDEAYTKVIVRAEGGSVCELTVKDGLAVFAGGKPGFYTAAAVKNGEESEPVEFCITAAQVQTDKQVYAQGEAVVLNCANAAGDPAVGYMVKQLNAPFGDRGQYLLKDGVPAPAKAENLAPGEYAAVSFFRNKYGVYTSERLPFTVKE